MNQSNMNEGKARLDAWYDGSAICLIARLQHCLAESEAGAAPD
ncbi:MAG: hypothetical protein RSD99_28855 [Janthinobacterium sp.]